MGCDLPKIHIEWDEAHAAGLKPELHAYRQIVSRLGSHEGVETSLDTTDGDERTWEHEPSDTQRERDNEPGVGNVLHDVRAMCRSLGRLRELGATVTIDGREATVAALNAYEDALAREVCQIRLNDHSTAAGSGNRVGNGESDGGLLSAIIYVVGLVVILRWLLSCS